jgi:hypothetical protein
MPWSFTCGTQRRARRRRRRVGAPARWHTWPVFGTTSGKYAHDRQEFLLEVGEDAPVLGEEQPDNLPARRHGPDPITAGAIHARALLGSDTRVGVAVQFAIAGHHGGLADLIALRDRVQKPEKLARYAASTARAPAEILELADAPGLPAFMRMPASKERVQRRFETFVRMLFSALVDADYLDTGRPPRGGAIRGSGPRRTPDARMAGAPWAIASPRRRPAPAAVAAQPLHQRGRRGADLSTRPARTS